MNECKIYGLLGYPVKHSLSGFMHNAAFKALNIDARYELFEIKPEELNFFLNSLSKKNIYGLNVTIPYKEKALDFVSLDKESFYVREIQAVNTIVRSNGKLKGFNTDVPGFSRHLKEQFEPNDKKVAILGAGGAGKAVVYVIFQSNAKEIVIYDKDKDKSSHLVNMIKETNKDYNIYSVDKIEQLNIPDKDLLINATPVGMNSSDPCLIKEEMLHKDLFIYDVIYNPPETKLLNLAKKVGAQHSNGLGMLLYQGMLSFKHWTGRDAPQEAMWQALVSHTSYK